MECSTALNSFGIPTDRLPLKYDGGIKTEDHLKWIAVREAKEDALRQGRAFDVVECPFNMDVLSGEFVLDRMGENNPHAHVLILFDTSLLIHDRKGSAGS
jgi:hypothetical protein